MLRLNKEEFGIIVKAVTKHELESLQQAIMFADNLIRRGFAEGKLAEQFIKEWQDMIFKLTRGHKRWLKL